MWEIKNKYLKNISIRLNQQNRKTTMKIKNKLLKSITVSCCICVPFSIFYVALYLLAKPDREPNEWLNLALLSLSLIIPFAVIIYLAYTIKGKLIKSVAFGISSYVSWGVFVAMSCLMWNMDFDEFNKEGEAGLLYATLILPLTTILYLSYLLFESYVFLRNFSNHIFHILTYIAIMLLAYSIVIYFSYTFTLTLGTILFALFIGIIYICVFWLQRYIECNFATNIRAILLFLVTQYICCVAFGVFVGL